ncbi:Transcription factor DIVARICATA [Cardamine amara subsp. amara]|uniref:Transcription factor DIVARICATA n=1 Tax=Cardamine amara subsp. amara TaxID=228776 RepID=A0ABD0YZG0_CARAN
MAETSWTRKENEIFKIALETFNPLLPSRFDYIAEYVGKPVAVVKGHYKKLVNDLLEVEASRLPLIEAASQVSSQGKKSKWTKETHEWFMIGLHRFGQNWDRIAILLNCVNRMEVEAYANNYYLWLKSEKKVMKRPRANDPTLEETEVRVMLRPRGNDFTLLGTNINLMERRQESLVHPPAQPQQEPSVRRGHHAEASNSEPYYYYI